MWFSLLCFLVAIFLFGVLVFSDSPEKKVVRYYLPFSHSFKKFISDDSRLIHAANDYANHMKQIGVEVWKIEKNIVIAENGYHCFIYSFKNMGVE